MKQKNKFWIFEIISLIGVIAIIFAVAKMPPGHLVTSFEWYDILGMFGVFFALVGVFGVTKNLRSRGLMH